MGGHVHDRVDGKNVIVADAVINSTAQLICETPELQNLFATIENAFTQEDGLRISDELFYKLQVAAGKIHEFKVNVQSSSVGLGRYTNTHNASTVGECSHTALSKANLTSDEIDLLAIKKVLEIKPIGNLTLIKSPALYHFCNVLIISEGIDELVRHLETIGKIVDQAVNKPPVDQVVFF